MTVSLRHSFERTRPASGSYAWRRVCLDDGGTVGRFEHVESFSVETDETDPVEVLSWGFKTMSLNRIEAQVHPENLPPMRSLRRLHFIEEGRLREDGFWGRPVPRFDPALVAQSRVGSTPGAGRS